MIGSECGSQVDASTGEDNVLVGYKTGNALGTGYNNVLIGSEAGEMLNNDSSNTMIGHQAGKYHAGGPNTFIGLGAGRSDGPLSSSIHNVAIGVNALYLIDNGGNYNVAVGHYASDDLTSGEYNVALGYKANSIGVTTGDYNVSIGYQAGDDLTSGLGNISIG